MIFQNKYFKKLTFYLCKSLQATNPLRNVTRIMFDKCNSYSLPDTMRASLGPTVCMLPISNQLLPYLTELRFVRFFPTFNLRRSAVCLGHRYWKVLHAEGASRKLLSIDPLLDTFTTCRASISSIAYLESDGSNTIQDDLFLRMSIASASN